MVSSHFISQVLLIPWQMWLLERFLIFKSENNGNLFAVPITPKKTELWLILHHYIVDHWAVINIISLHCGSLSCD